MTSSLPLLLLAGPTAAGKTDVALALAEKLGGEMISVDSMQVYRGMDIGTAKPTLEERARAPHHLLDVVNVSEGFDAAQFVRLAQTAAAEIQSRGRLAILCGGTGLYFKAFLEGLGQGPASAPALRETLEKTPLPELLEELAARDPVAFEKIDRQNPRRVIRAVEVIRLTGMPYSAQRAVWSKAIPCPHPFFALERSPDDLKGRIDRRVDEMFRRGLVKETEGLLAQGLGGNRFAMQALGYRQVAEYLRGEHTLEETIELVKIKTRQFAKRQMTWFRGQLKPEWIMMTPEQSAEATVETLLEKLREKCP
jgi:tRNA dimethylallyltransferase